MEEGPGSDPGSQNMQWRTPRLQTARTVVPPTALTIVLTMAPTMALTLATVALTMAPTVATTMALTVALTGTRRATKPARGRCRETGGARRWC